MGDTLSRKESLVLTAIEIIDEIGIEGLSTREIAKRQGLSEGAMFRHFKSKNDLIIAVLDHFDYYNKDINQYIDSKKMDPKEALLYFISCYAAHYEKYSAVSAIEQAYDFFRTHAGLEEKIRDICFKRTSFIKAMIEKAQKAGEIDPEINSENLSDVIIGCCRAISLKWRMGGKHFPVQERVMATLEMILNAFSP